ncbi:hypothetical protein GC105_10365 [Alkalibaculum sp. M08DMB]|uniref:UVR domain-containing protein n=1 Tax=Alkalibaculum sporogenes TaxID=2655001 RepID=A0A6A7K9Z5_9FIRM|nr:UvrB/UvrC motif-containing protein [Alkalibaculum sporogenes]MPW26192.1 hypothetical protein [Alkalibaculum sporogenes]
MLCQNCNERAASIHITKIMSGEKREIHLCDQCSALHEMFNSSFNFQGFIANLLDLEENTHAVDYSHSMEYHCPQCGMDYDTFKKHGKFGCEKCYETFSLLINPMIQRMHGKEQHIGKIVKYGGENIRLKRELTSLHGNLSLAIEKEEYEKAALLRDQIKILKEQIKDNIKS